MKREDLLSKGFTEEQVTDLLNLFHAEQNVIASENKKLKLDLQTANSQIENLNNVKAEYDTLKMSQMTEQEKYEAMKKEIEENLVKSKKVSNKAQAKTILAEIGGIDDNILDSLVSEDENVTIENATKLLNMIKSRDEAVSKKAKEELAKANVLPNPSNVTDNNSSRKMSKEDFNNLSIAEKTKIFKENKKLWSEMTQQK